MKWFLFFISFLVSRGIHSQCTPPSNTTFTISGLHTSDINLPPGNVIYVAPNAVVTGNIYLNNSSLVNCGSILSKKIVMHQSQTNFINTFYNLNEVDCDSVICDTMGHIHNLLSFKVRYLALLNNTSVDNYYSMQIGRIKVNSGVLSSNANMQCDYLVLENDSRFLSLYSNLVVRKLLDVDLTSDLYGGMQVCVDSAFVNKGNVMVYVPASTYISNMAVLGSSINYGNILNLDFCDLSSGNSGLDQNLGTLTNVTYCNNSATTCNFYSTEIIESEKEVLKIGVFPNPVSDFLYINNNGKYDLKDAKFEVLNTPGQIIISGEFNSEVNVSQLSQGFYSLKIKQKSGPILYSNFIKQ